MVLIWTRSQADWSEDQALFQGVPVYHLPCIQTHSLPWPVLPPLEPSYHVIFTSSKAVHYAHKSPLWPSLQAGKLWSIGAATQSCLPHAHHPPQVKQAADFNRLFSTLPPSQVLLPGSKVRAYPLDLTLAKQGFRTHKLDLYQTTVTKLSDTDIPKPAVICFASPSAVKAFAACDTRDLHACCIGPTTRQAASDLFSSVFSSPKADLKSLVKTAVNIQKTAKIF